MVRGPSIVFKGVALVDETLIRMSANICKSIVGIDARQIYPNFMCQPIPTGLYTSFELDEDLQRFKQKQNKTSFENKVMSHNESDPSVK